MRWMQKSQIPLTFSLKVQFLGFKGFYLLNIAEMENNIHKYVLICVLPPEKKGHCVFITLEWAYRAGPVPQSMLCCTAVFPQ